MEKDLVEKYGGVTADAMVESVVRQCRYFEEQNFDQLIIAVKSSSVPMSIEAYRKISKEVDYPLHIGVTETGVSTQAVIKSTLGIGILLAEGIGDTLRVSLSGDIEEQVQIGVGILRGLGIRRTGIELIACPTCGRCRVNAVEIAKQVYDRTRLMHKNLKVAVMGCSVNGPGEAREADIGIAGGNGEFLLFKKGEIIRKIPNEHALDELIYEIEQM
jgi:(E)-4-hydroxy-3-methylbut-2-enyl-diphosphate synthase